LRRRGRDVTLKKRVGARGEYILTENKAALEYSAREFGGPKIKEGRRTGRGGVLGKWKKGKQLLYGKGHRTCRHIHEGELRKTIILSKREKYGKVAGGERGGTTLPLLIHGCLSGHDMCERCAEKEMDGRRREKAEGGS